MMHPLEILPEDTVVVVVDMQERLLEAFQETTPLERGVCRMIRTARLLHVPLVVTEQYPKGLGDTTASVLADLPEQQVRISKTAFSCWGAAAFCATMTSLKPSSLVLTGVETHVCIQQTALAAQARGYQVIVPLDAVESRHAYSKLAALSLMRENGIVVTTAEALAFAWLKDARHPQFKNVSKLFKAG
ncbi:MAG: isochorismatase family protein [Candidatus Pacebacteria bacterium]|nr:isochorismatase family protein [Candidatus Paceibacterota bacterium]